MTRGLGARPARAQLKSRPAHPHRPRARTETKGAPAPSTNNIAGLYSWWAHPPPNAVMSTGLPALWAPRQPAYLRAHADRDAAATAPAATRCRCSALQPTGQRTKLPDCGAGGYRSAWPLQAPPSRPPLRPTAAPHPAAVAAPRAAPRPTPRPSPRRPGRAPRGAAARWPARARHAAPHSPPPGGTARSGRPGQRRGPAALAAPPRACPCRHAGRWCWRDAAGAACWPARRAASGASPGPHGTSGTARWRVGPAVHHAWGLFAPSARQLLTCGV
jgi:hypothetical protein